MIHGSCLCGSVRFRLEGELTSARLCFCRSCTKFAGTSPVAWAMAESAGLKRESPAGRVQEYDSGRGLRCFCAECGSPVWFESHDHSEIVAIPLGVLDDGTIPEPEMQIWTRSRPSWCRLEAELPAHETDP